MTQESNVASWGEDDSQTFIDYGRYFVPERELQIETICSAVPDVAGQQHVLDLCCGEGVLVRALLDRFPHYQVHGLDGSPTMIETANTTLQSYGERFQPQIFDLTSSDWRVFPYPILAVVSSLAIHHLDASEKQQLFKDVYRMLSPDGVFGIADVIQPVSQTGISIAAKMWDDAVRQRSLQLDGNLKAYQRFLDLEWNSFTLAEPDPIDKMSPLYEQLKWLEQAGFVDVDVFWCKAGHAVFGGRKPGNK